MPVLRLLRVLRYCSGNSRRAVTWLETHDLGPASPVAWVVRSREVPAHKKHSNHW